MWRRRRFRHWLTGICFYSRLWGFWDSLCIRWLEPGNLSLCRGDELSGSSVFQSPFLLAIAPRSPNSLGNGRQPKRHNSAPQLLVSREKTFDPPRRNTDPSFFNLDRTSFLYPKRFIPRLAIQKGEPNPA